MIIIKSSCLLGLLLAPLLISSLVSCTQTVTTPQSQLNPPELRQTEENKFRELYSEMKFHVEKANSLILDLYYFDWGKLGSIGRIPGMPGLYSPTGTIYFWVNNQVVEFQPLSNELPNKKDIEPLVTDAEKCLYFASSIWSNSPYQEPQAVVGKGEQSTINQWRSYCTELSQQLTKTEAQGTEFKNVTQNTYLVNMENTLDSWDWVKKNYLPAFQQSSTSYLELIDSTIAELKEAQKYTSQWRKTTLRCQILSSGQD
jgi:hypothetical protein